MKRRTWILFGVTLLVLGFILFTFLDPSARVRGWVGGEPFFQGRSATAWRHDLSAPDEVKSTAARESLTNGKGEAVPVCVWLLGHASEPEVRARSADSLKQMGGDAKPAGEALLKALDDPDPIVKGVAFQAVDALVPDLPAGAVAKLMTLFPNIDAIRAVAKFGPSAKEAIPKLVELLKNEEPTVRFQAARALGKIGETSISQTPELIRLMGSDPNDKVREISAEVIGLFGPPVLKAYPEVVPTLAKAIKDPAWNVRRDAVRSMGQLGSVSIPYTLDFIRLMDSDPNDKVREISAEVIGLFGPPVVAAYPETVPALAKALKDEAWNVRREAVRSLGQLGPAAKAVLNDVKAVEKDMDERVRTAASKSVRQIEATGK